MKKIILTTIIAFAALAVSAQTKKETEVKPEWRPDVTRQVPITITPTVQQMNDFLIFISMGSALDDSTDKSAKQVKVIKENAALVYQSLNKSFQDYLLADQKKFQADTAAKSKPKR